jgi:DNA-binding MarR family transcriptional regulator
MSRGQRDALIRQVQLALRGLHSAVDTVNQGVADELGINRTDLRCLEIVARHGPLTAGRLAEEANLTTSAVTTVLDRLEQAGFARRVRDATDRRRILVELTSEASQRLSALYHGLLAASTANLERYSEAELHLILDFVERGREITLDHAARIKNRSRL